MATLEANVKAALTGSAAWVALVAGGTYLLDDLPRTGLTPDGASYDSGGKLRPTCVITMETESEDTVLRTERRFFRLYCYTDADFATLRSMKRMAKSLLDGKRIASDNESYALARYVDSVREYYDDSMAGAAAASVRFYLLYRRT